MKVVVTGGAGFKICKAKRKYGRMGLLNLFVISRSVF